MADWSKWELGRERLPERAIIFGGNTPRSSIDRMVNSYDQVLFHKHDNYEPFIVESCAQHRGRVWTMDLMVSPREQ
jgi:hypothetical protein